MKKTFTLLMAAAGMAVAAPTPVELEWVNGTANLSSESVADDFKNNEITVVFTLTNLDLQGDMIMYVEGKYSAYTDGSAKFGLINDYSAYSYNDIACLYADNARDYLGYHGLDGKEQAAIAYTMRYNSDANTTDASLSLYWLNAKGEIASELVYKSLSGKKAGIYDFSTLWVHENVADKVLVYGEALDSEMAKDVLKNYLTVPEPTTATLSLLALAGLAARRRRH